MLRTDKTPILRIEGLRKNYGAVQALCGIDLDIFNGELCGLIGPNGSGKTTLFDCCTGLQRPDAGTVILDAQDITGWSMNRIARDCRMVRSFQKTVVFSSMNVVENLITAGQMFSFTGLPSTFFKGRAASRRISNLRQKALELIDFMALTHVKGMAAGTLSLGQQKLLQFASVLMTDPQVVLLDEPLAGVNPILIEHLTESIERTNRTLGVTFVIIEHNIDVLLNLCPRIVVLDQGSKLADGDPQSIVKDQRVVEAYLG